jgi:ABC-2 type transport system permease protein/lipopolysaccharide transport system permease protein
VDPSEEAPEAMKGASHVPFREARDLPASPPPRRRDRVRSLKSLRELLAGREILMTFFERDLRLRYRQAALGAAWALLQPLLLMVVFTFVFGRIARTGSEGAPYAVFAYSGLVPWGFFAGSINYGTGSILTNAPIVRKVYLPREVFPLASVLSAGADLVVAGAILLVMLVAYGLHPSVAWLGALLLLGILAVLSVAVTMAASLVTVYFRDTRFAVPTLLQVLLYATPVAYPLATVRRALPGRLGSLYELNPLVPIIDGFHRTLLHGQWPEWGPVGVAAGVSTLALTLAYRWYKSVDRVFADVI